MPKLPRKLSVVSHPAVSIQDQNVIVKPTNEVVGVFSIRGIRTQMAMIGK